MALRHIATPRCSSTLRYLAKCTQICINEKPSNWVLIYSDSFISQQAGVLICAYEIITQFDGHKIAFPHQQVDSQGETDDWDI